MELVNLNKRSKNKVSNSSEMQRERISELPDSLLCEILSFLDMKDAIRTSLISKRWRHLWVSTHNLNFSILEWSCTRTGKLRFDEFEKFVDKVMLIRDGSHINKFRLTCPSFNPKTTHRWISYAVSQHALQLHLEHLTLPMNTSIFSQVKTLKLVLVSLIPRIQNPPKKLVLRLPVVENLILRHCDHLRNGSLIIFAPQLKNFTVDNINRPLYSIDVRSSNLTSIQLKGHLYNGFSLENSSPLITAELSMRNHEMNQPTTLLFRRDLLQVFNILASAKSLTLSAHVVQDFLQWPNELKVLISFPNVRYLKLSDWPKADCVNAMAVIFESFPNVETLVLEMNLFMKTRRITISCKQQ